MYYINNIARLGVVGPAVLLHANFPCRHVFVADMPQRSPPRSLALLVPLRLEGLRVVQSADVCLKLFLAIYLLLLFHLLCGLVTDAPLTAPVAPDVD